MVSIFSKNWFYVTLYVDKSNISFRRSCFILWAFFNRSCMLFFKGLWQLMFAVQLCKYKWNHDMFMFEQKGIVGYRGGGRVVLIALPSLPSVISSFLPKIRRGLGPPGPSPRSATEQWCILATVIFSNKQLKLAKYCSLFPLQLEQEQYFINCERLAWFISEPWKLKLRDVGETKAGSSENS